MEKRDGFNVGDIVKFDLSNPENRELLVRNGGEGNLTNINFKIVDVNWNREQIDLDKPLFKDDSHGQGWYAWRFTLDKNYIVRGILNDL